MEITNNTLELKPYSKKELADLYGISFKTLNSWLSPFKSQIGIYRGRLYTVNQVKMIFDKLGLPGTIGEPLDETPKKKTA